MGEFAPQDVMRGALRVLFVAAYTTRNWTLNEDVSRKQINDLWEAIHELPSLLYNWRGVDSERDLDYYLKEYNQNWETPDLLSIYEQARKSGQGGTDPSTSSG